MRLPSFFIKPSLSRCCYFYSVVWIHTNYRYNSDPSYQTAGAFAMGVVLMAAIELSQSLDPSILAQTLQNNFFPTIYGNVTFGPNRLGTSLYLMGQVSSSTSSSTSSVVLVV